MTEDKDIMCMDKEELEEHKKFLRIGIDSIKITEIDPDLVEEITDEYELEIAQVDNLLKYF